LRVRVPADPVRRARPQSWHLTDAERASIRLQWSAYEGHAQQIARWLRGMPADCPPPGT
jgi:hypothetical protein